MSAREGRGRRLARYELIAEIASGGMGVVLLARTGGAGGFQRLFAVKIMHPHLVEDTQFVSMLIDEARVAARIHHPNVVPTVDISQHANLHFLVMDYVEGFQLGEILSHPGFSPPDRLRVANRILLDAMSGLEAAHNLQSDDGSALGIVHRDVSPQNILVGVDGVGRLTDFGIAFALSRITASRPGIIKGKPAYMAPEQALGKNVDRRADIWALGVMLWETMTGRRLFVADTDVGTILRVINEPIPLPRAIVPELPAELEAVCMRALARDPAQRYATAREMAADLDRAARYRNLLVDAPAMPQWISDAFGPAIAARRAEIRQHIAALAADGTPMSSSDVYQLPRLSDSLTRARPSPVSAPPRSAIVVAAERTRVKSPVKAVAPVALRSSAQRDVNQAPTKLSRDETPLSSSRKAAEKKPMQRSTMLVFGLFAVLVGVLLFVAGRRSSTSPVGSSQGPASALAPPQPAAAAPAREAIAPSSPSSAPVVVPAPARPSESTAVPSLPTSGTQSPASTPAAPVTPPRPAPAAAAALSPGLLDAPPAARRDEAPKYRAAQPAPGGHQVTIEENPYSLR